MSPRKLPRNVISQIFLFVLLFCPVTAVGQFVVPFFYMPLKSLFPTDLGSEPKHFKVTSEHVRAKYNWTPQQTYERIMDTLRVEGISVTASSLVKASDLIDLDYYWSYNLPFNEADPSLRDVSSIPSLTAGYMQEQLLKNVSQKFAFDLNSVTSTMGINVSDLWTSYDPANWETLVHAMINESSTSFTKLLDLPSSSSLADLVGISPAELLNTNLSRFEALVFPFIPKKAILDAKATLYLINSLGIPPGMANNDIAIGDILEKHENITLTLREFGILYNLTNEQSKALVKARFSQIFHLCGVSFESIKNLTLPDVSHRVVGSVHSTPPCPLLISIKGKSIRSFEANINPQTTTVLEILLVVSNLTWRDVREALDGSLPDWEFLDSVTLAQLAETSGHSVESLLNTTASDAVELVFKTRANGNLTSRMEAHRLFIRSLLVEKFNLTLIEVANLTKSQEAFMLNYSSPLLFSRFLNATMTYFGLNLSEIISSVQVSTAELFNLPRQEWMSVISAIFNAVLKAEASDLEMSTGDLLQLLGIAAVEPSISKLKELINEQILAFKEKKRRLFAFRNSPLADLAASKGLILSSLNNDTAFDVIVTVLSVPVEDASFIFNWTEQERTKLQMFTLKEVASYGNIALENLGSYKLLELVEYVFLMPVTSSLPPIISTTSLPPCKQGFRRVDDACIDDDECSSVDRCSDDSSCQNYLGGFDCECKDPGYFKAKIDTSCKPCKTFSGTLNIPDRELNAVLSNRSTEDFYLMKKSFETTVNNELRKSPVGQFFFGSRLKDFRSGSIIVDFYIFMSRDFSGKIQDLQNALIGRIYNSKLGPFTVTASEVAVEDFDECKAHDDNCGQHATCVNNVGSFECKCKDGFEGDGISCEGGVFETIWWILIIAALLFLVMVIIIVCLVIKGPNLSTPGTADRLNPGSDNGSHTPQHSVENYGAQASNGSGDKRPPEVAMEMNKRTSGEIPESGKLDHLL